jgi:hypothetical protein
VTLVRILIVSVDARVNIIRDMSIDIENMIHLNLISAHCFPVIFILCSKTNARKYLEIKYIV